MIAVPNDPRSADWEAFNDVTGYSASECREAALFQDAIEAEWLAEHPDCHECDQSAENVISVLWEDPVTGYGLYGLWSLCGSHTPKPYRLRGGR